MSYFFYNSFVYKFELQKAYVFVHFEIFFLGARDFDANPFSIFKFIISLLAQQNLLTPTDCLGWAPSRESWKLVDRKKRGYLAFFVGKCARSILISSLVGLLSPYLESRLVLVHFVQMTLWSFDPI